MPKTPQKDEYRRTDKRYEVEHVPTDYKVFLRYPNQGVVPNPDYGFLRGIEGDYVEGEIVSFGLKLLMEWRQEG